MRKRYHRGYRQQWRGRPGSRRLAVRKPMRTQLTTPFDTPRISPGGVPYVRIKDPIMGITLTNELERLVGRRLPATHSLLWKLNNNL